MASLQRLRIGLPRRSLFRRAFRKKNILRSFASGQSIHHLVVEEDVSSRAVDNSLASLIDIENKGSILLASSSVPVEDLRWYDGVTDLVLFVHNATGLPYAASIASITILGRILIVPVAIWHLRNNPWEPHLLELKELYDKSNNPVVKNRYKTEINAIQKQFPRINRFALPMASLGTTIFMWMGLRRMGTLYPEEMATGGIGWFIDLTQPDPYLFLPILSNFLLFSAHELGADETGRPRQELPNRWLRYGVRGFKIGLFGLWFFLPSSILCFWIPHSALSCLQTVVFSQPTVIQSFGFGRGGRDHPVPTNMAENDYSEIQYYKDAANEESQVKANKTEEESTPKPSILSPVRIRKGRKKPNVHRRKNK